MTENNAQVSIKVSVVYPLPDEQKIFTLEVPKTMTVLDIIKASGILAAYPEIDLAKNRVGIFSRAVKLDSTVKNKDRIEIYRPLVADPKEIRLRRVEQTKAKLAAKQRATQELSSKNTNIKAADR